MELYTSLDNVCIDVNLTANTLSYFHENDIYFRLLLFIYLFIISASLRISKFLARLESETNKPVLYLCTSTKLNLQANTANFEQTC